MASFWDELGQFGTGLLDDVGEGTGNLIKGWTNQVTNDTRANPGNYQQPTKQTYADGNGNRVTRPQGAYQQAGFVGGLSNREMIAYGSLLLLFLYVVAR